MEELVDKIVGHKTCNFMVYSWSIIKLQYHDKIIQLEQMLFGAMNAPMMFQRVMELIFAPNIHKLFHITKMMQSMVPHINMLAIWNKYSKLIKTLCKFEH